MYKSFMLPPLAMAMLLCTACRQERTLYCNSSDPTSFRLIPKREPFTAVTDSIGFYTGQTINCLWSISHKTSQVQHKATLYGIAELRHYTPVSLPRLKQCYTAFCCMPCNDSIYRTYQNSLIALEERLAETRHLYADVKNIAAKKNINTADVSQALSKVSAYTHNRAAVFTRH